MSVTVAAILPILLMYLFFQNYFVASVAVERGQGLTWPPWRTPASDGRRARASPGRSGRPPFDFYYQSIRLVPANLLWGGALLAVARGSGSGPARSWRSRPRRCSRSRTSPSPGWRP